MVVPPGVMGRAGSRGSAGALAALLLTAGTTHLLRPRPYERLIPRSLGRPRAWVLGSGVAEIACGVAVAAPRTRRHGALATAALFVLVLPGNVVMALDSLRGSHGTAYRAAVWGRLPLQVPLVLWALAVAQRPQRVGRSGTGSSRLVRTASRATSSSCP